MQKGRLMVLLANALEYIEECVGHGIMEDKTAYSLGITQEEYDEVLSVGVTTYCNDRHTFKIVDKIPKHYGIWAIGQGMQSDDYAPFCELQPERGDRAINPDTLLTVRLPRNEVLLLRKVSAVGSTLQELEEALEDTFAHRFASPEEIKQAIGILTRLMEE